MIDGLTPEELERVLSDPSEKGVNRFRQIIRTRKDVSRMTRSDNYASWQVDKAKELCHDLEQEKLVKVQWGFPHEDIINVYTSRQAMSVVQGQLEKVESKDIRESSIAMSEIYRVNYENMGKKFFKPIVKLITGNEPNSVGFAIGHLKTYKGGKYRELFECLNPQIRNSIEHQDYLIDKKHKMITFNDRGKPSLKLQYKQFKTIFGQSFTLSMAMSAADFEIQEPLLEIILEQKEIVAKMIKRFRLKPEVGRSFSKVFVTAAWA